MTVAQRHIGDDLGSAILVLNDLVVCSVGKPRSWDYDDVIAGRRRGSTTNAKTAPHATTPAHTSEPWLNPSAKEEWTTATMTFACGVA